MTDLTDDQVRALAHRYRFAKDDHERTIAQTALALLTARAEKAEAESRVWDHAAQIGGDAAVEVLLRHEPDAGPLKIQMTRQAIANPIRRTPSPEVQALIAAKLEEAVNALDGITKPAIPPGPENSVTGRAFDSGQEAAVARFKQAIGRLITPDMARALAAVKAEAWREGMALAEEIAESIETEGGGGADAAAAIRAWRAIEGVPGAAIRADGGE